MAYDEYSVEILADSLSAVGNHRITSLVIIFPRMVLAEFNTHRLFSRNSASSRAIPITKMTKQVEEHPFIPNRFPKTHTGMQASEWIEKDNPNYGNLVLEWLLARDEAVNRVKHLHELGVSKQLLNRILEPFLMHKVIVTATEWENFLALRAHDAAQNEIRIIAEMILEVLNTSTPVQLEEGQWHLPFGSRVDNTRMTELLAAKPALASSPEELARKISTARCARVSYLDFNGKDDYEADVALFERLKVDGHWSPFEHTARAMSKMEYAMYSHTYPGRIESGWCGNFRGFIQLRRLFARALENRTDERLLVR